MLLQCERSALKSWGTAGYITVLKQLQIQITTICKTALTHRSSTLEELVMRECSCSLIEPQALGNALNSLNASVLVDKMLCDGLDTLRLNAHDGLVCAFS